MATSTRQFAVLIEKFPGLNVSGRARGLTLVKTIRPQRVAGGAGTVLTLIHDVLGRFFRGTAWTEKPHDDRGSQG